MPERAEVEAVRAFTICTRCWVVVGIDGENNLDRATTVCSHLGPFIQASSSRGDGTVAVEDQVGWLTTYQRAYRQMQDRARAAESELERLRGDGTVAVEDVAEWLRVRAGRTHGNGASSALYAAARDLRAEFGSACPAESKQNADGG